MAIKKKTTTRKYAAVALGIVGIAGLSLASAAQLSVNEDSPLVGVSVDSSDCDDAVDVAYGTSYAAGAFTVTSVTVSGIHADCIGKDLNVYVLDDSATPVTLGSAAREIAGATETFDVTAQTIDAEDVYEAAVSIN